MKKCSKYIIWVLVVLPLFLPWFNYNSKVTTGCWGYMFLGELLLPLALITIAVFKESKYSRVLSLIGLALYFAVMVLAIGLWNQKTNVLSGFKWSCSIRTFMWGYWVSLFCIIAFAITFTIYKKKQR